MNHLLPADPAALPTLLEGLMLLCFGLAWPVANVRMLRTRRAEGKGLAFTLIILCGYVAGAAAKLLLVAQGHALPPVFWLYVLNTLSVALNLALQWHLGRRAHRARRATQAVAGGGLTRDAVAAAAAPPRRPAPARC